MFGKLENRGVGKAARGFSLVELLVVIGIISLLIGIALPAFSAAKNRAKIATTTAIINAISTGIEQFRADDRLGGQYPPSERTELPANPHLPDGKVQRLQYANGANLIVYALAGADLLGSAGIRDTDGDGYWQDNLNQQTSEQGLYRWEFVAGSGSKPAVARTSFVDVSKMKFPTKVEDGSSSTPLFEVPSNKTTRMQSLTFLDSFDQPILYYRANSGRPAICSLGLSIPSGKANNGIYDMTDNVDLTGVRQQGKVIQGADIGAGTGHFPANGDNVWRAPITDLLNPAKRDTYKGTFAYSIYNPSVTATVMPHNAETYILLSAGPDGLYGTEDDITNFPTNK